MAVGVQKAWSVTASSNASADSNVSMAEGQTPASLNDGVRAAMAAIKGWANQIGAAKTSGGSANAQTLTSDSVAAISTAYAAGMIFCFKAGYTNSTTTPTFNVDGVGAKTIKKGGAQAALAASDIIAGGIYWVAYEASGDCFLLLNPESGLGNTQPLDATLTALAAGTTGADVLFYWSGTDTLSTTTLTTAGRALIDDAAASDQRTTLGLGTAATQNTGTSGTNVPLLDGANTWSNQQRISTTSPIFELYETDGGTNAKLWYEIADGGVLRLRLANDANSVTNDVWAITRTAHTAATVAFGSIVSALTWNGNTVFTTAGGTLTGGLTGTTGTFSGSVQAADISVTSTYPIITLYDTDSGTNEKGWSILGSGGYLQFVPRSDAYGSGNAVLLFTRSGTTNTIAEFDEADLRMELSPSSLATNSVGPRALFQNAQNANYTYVLGDSGGHLYHSNATPYTWTIPANASVAYPIGTVLSGINDGAGAISLAITTDTLQWGSLTGTRTIAQYGSYRAVKVTSTKWILDGIGIS